MNTPEVELYGWMDQDGYVWGRAGNEEPTYAKACEHAFNYFESKPFSLRPCYICVVDEEEVKFNGY